MGWEEKILSWFQKDESAFSNLEIQPLSLGDHPENIVVFEAVSLYEACLKADRALRQEGIQGAVWARNEQAPFLEDPLAALKATREKSGSYAFDSSSMRSAMGLSLQTDMIRNPDGTYTPRFDSFRNVNAEDVIEPQRLADLHQLTKIFGVNTLNVRYQMAEKIDPHYDYFTDSAPMGGEEDKFFMGRPMRILVSRNQPSVILYNTQGETAEPNRSGNIRGAERNALKEAWQPAVGDYVFLCNYTWGMDKVLPHSPPHFSCEREEDARVIDVYDSKDGLELPEFAKLGTPETEPG